MSEEKLMTLISLLLPGLACAIFVFLTLRKDKLRNFPGPRLASLSELWMVWHVHGERRKEPLRELHEKYGRIVRTGPNKLSFADPAAAKDILSISKDLKKSDWYPVQAPSANGYVVVNMFASTDAAYHDTIRRLVNRPFSMAVVPSYEAQIDAVIEIFLEQIRRRFSGKLDVTGTFDLAKWVQYFALDTISMIAFSESYGFLQADEDVADLMRDNRFFLKYCQYVSQAPWLDKLFLKNPLLLWLNRHGIAQYNPKAALFAADLQHRRELELREGASTRDDVLDSLLQIKQDHPDDMNEQEVLKVCLAIVFAGADTTAMLITATFRFLMKHPGVYRKLLEEIDQLTGFSYAQHQRAPYLDAVIKESARMFPVVRFGYERVTPPTGMVINGHEVPGGVNVSVNPWVIQRDPAIWGDDVDAFRPERWLVDDENYRSMASKLLLFGAGKYQCLGIHIAWTEIYRIVPAVLKAFKIEPVSEDVDWQWEPGLFVMLNSVNVRVTSRAM